MSKDFLIGFLFAIVILLILFMIAPDSPSTKRRKRQPVPKRGDTTNQDWWREGVAR